MARKEYTEEQRAAYKAGLAAAKKTAKRGSSAGRSKARTDNRRKKGAGEDYTKRSACTLVQSYTRKSDGKLIEKPKISGYRIDKNIGYQTFVAFLSKNDGLPKNEANAERFRNFVVTLTSRAGKSTVNGLYDSKYGKLKMIELGLVANPKGGAGGYFGPGGTRYKAKATK